jgi:ABC-type phosphate transport system substrate-binding protein
MKNLKGYMIRLFILLLYFWAALSIDIVSAVSERNDEKGEGFYIIVNVNNTIDSVTVNQLSRIFNKKAKKFENDMASLPVAQKSTRFVTEIFNRTILKKNAKQLKYYWARKMFSGSNKPPKALASDTEVVKFVASVKNAVGYVSEIPKNKNVKVIDIKP